MAKIKVAHLRKFLQQYLEEKITFSKVVEKLNAVAEDDTKCKSCGRELDAIAIKESELCTACFTSNA